MSTQKSHSGEYDGLGIAKLDMYPFANYDEAYI